MQVCIHTDCILIYTQRSFSIHKFPLYVFLLCICSIFSRLTQFWLFAKRLQISFKQIAAHAIQKEK